MDQRTKQVGYGYITIEMEYRLYKEFDKEIMPNKETLYRAKSLRKYS